MRTELGYRKLCKRLDVPGDAHYLTFSCFRNQAFLRDETACHWLIEAISAARSKHPFDLWAWVFMPDHVHLLIMPQDGIGISRILSSIKTPVAKRAAGRGRREAPELALAMSDIQPNGKQFLRFWQRGGGYDRNIWSTEEIHEKIGYIHNNPVRRELVGIPEAWRWSSCAAWENGTDDLLSIDRDTFP